MNAADALLAAVHADPHDDGPRLVYADWLDEHGDPERAEFIRVQCELARASEDDPRRPTLEGRERLLLSRHGKAWKGNDPHVRGGTFQRGFLVPRRWSLSASDFLRLKPEAFDAAPLWEVRLRDVLTTMPRIAASPHLGRLCGLHIEKEYLVNDDHVRALAASPYLSNLTTLNLAENRIGDAGVEVLAAAPVLHRLTRLDLTSARVGDAGAQALAASPSFGRLRELLLGGIKVGTAVPRLSEASVAALAGSTTLANLTTLDLGRCLRDGDAALRLFTEATFLPGLRVLRLEKNGISPVGLRALLRSPRLGPLTELNLYDNRVGTQGAELLASTPRLVTLRTLFLSSNGIDDAGVAALTNSSHLGGLTTLTLSDAITDAGARVLAAAPHWQGLTRLVVRSAALTATGERLLRDRWGDRVVC
jgi:uncharacterized protein (TIGR02996 family)